ncbi:MAG: flagellar biosynthesis anti-sigma factor FlgM [Pseudomonadota bacterium]
MKISSNLPTIGNAPGTGSPKGVASADKSAGTPSGERVDISSLSARLQEVGAGETPVNAQKVAEIKQAISEGRFQINPERIADGLLNSVRDMLAVAKR